MKKASILFSVFFVALIVVRHVLVSDLGGALKVYFWYSSLLLGLCGCMVFHLYWTRGGSSRGARFYIGLLLIISSAFMFAAFDDVAKSTAAWEPVLQDKYPGIILMLKQFVDYAKNIVSFGFAALGATTFRTGGIRYRRIYRR